MRERNKRKWRESKQKLERKVGRKSGERVERESCERKYNKNQREKVVRESMISRKRKQRVACVQYLCSINESGLYVVREMIFFQVLKNKTKTQNTSFYSFLNTV